MGVETIILFLLMCKHTLADLAMQQIRKPATKRLYLNKGLHVHALDHAVLTLVVLVFFINPWLALVFAVLDYVTHWHIDWFKSKMLWIFEIPREGSLFWCIQTCDQLCHYATYALIVYLIC
jgi:hypothetical protein